MRHIPLNEIIEELFSGDQGTRIRQRLERAHAKATRMEAERRHAYIRRTGPKKWSPMKARLTAKLGNKCWYTEAEQVGGDLVVDHYRPICDYWWLAYEAENYRLACSYANSPHHNEEHGCAGGKGDSFPLLNPGQRAQMKEELATEAPIILDPCKQEDCELLAFQADGRPVLNPEKSTDVHAHDRVEQSKILLNLDHPDFNSKREQLCRHIAADVRTYEELPKKSKSRTDIRGRLARMIAADAPFSTAARCYLRFHRHLDWVEKLLATG